MCKSKNDLSRRDFLRFGAGALEAVLLTGLGDEQLVRMTATLADATPPDLKPTAEAGALADTILVNGHIITVDAENSIAQAIAIKDGLVLQTGTSEEVRTLTGPKTQTIDLRGRTVSPGLIDAHNHLQVWSTLLGNYVPLIPPEVRTMDDMLKRLSQVIAKTSPGEWVQGYFWQMEPLLTRAELDPISPKNPLWLIHQGGHFATCNSLALEKAGISAQTRNPAGGIIVRDPKGKPTGALFNHRAMDLVRKYAPQPTSRQVAENIKFGEKKMAEVGVTTFQDVNARLRAIQGYLEAGRAKAMMLRAQVFYTLEWPEDLHRALNEIKRYSDDYMRFAGYKLLIDGQFPTWYTHEPHPGISWNMPTWKPDMFKKTVQALHDTGLQVAVHCGGDAAVDLALDAYESAMNANPRRDPRHRLEHATLCSKDAVQRASDLGVVISTQPQFIRFSRHLPDKLGMERASRIMVTRDWLDAGITVALGSDTPTSPWYEPQITLVGSVLRPDANNRRFHPEQALTVQEALRAHTMGSAYAAFEEKVKGSLEPGKMADLAVWSNNIYGIRPIDILKTKIEMTMIGGKVIYQA